jgi:hypothetical protein
MERGTPFLLRQVAQGRAALLPANVSRKGATTVAVRFNSSLRRLCGLCAIAAYSILVGCGGGGGGGLPDPGLSNVKVESNRAKSAVISPDGGTLSATGSNGVVYTLTVPEGAVDEETQIGMYPISNLANLPGGETTPAGVHLTPEGQQFLLGAKLTMQLPPGMDPKQLIGLTYERNAEQVRQDIFTVEGQTVTMFAHHFSGKALGRRQLDQLLNTFPMNNRADQFQRDMAAARNLAFRLSQDPTSAYKRILQEWYLTVVKPALLAGAANSVTENALAEAISGYDAWLDAVLFAQIDTLNVNFPIQVELAESETLAVAMLKRFYRFFNDRCLANTSGDVNSTGDDNPVFNAGSAMGVSIILRNWQIDAASNQLDDETLLNDLCVKVKIESIQAAAGFAPGSIEAVGVKAGFAINNGPVRRSPRIKVSFLTGGGISTYSPTNGPTDAQGEIVSIANWPASASQVTVKVRGCIDHSNPRINFVARRICRFDQRLFQGSGGATVSLTTPSQTRYELCAGTVEFLATVSGNVNDRSVTVTGGSGTFDPASGITRISVPVPATSGTVTVTATSNADPTARATASIEVDPVLGTWLETRSSTPVLGVSRGSDGTYTWLFFSTTFRGDKSGARAADGSTISLSGGGMSAVITVRSAGGETRMEVHHANCVVR